MYINIFQTFSFCQLKQCVQVCIVAVYTAVREQTEQMQGTSVFFCTLYCMQQCFVFEEISILDFFCDSGQFLVYDTSGTHVQMSDFRVTHLSIRQTYCQTTCIAFYERTLSHQLVHNRSFRLCYCVAFYLIIQSISIKNHQNGWLFAHFSISPLYYNDDAGA